MRIVQILPRAPESHEALGAFALALAQGLEVHGIYSDFLAAGGQTPARLEQELRASGVPPRAALLHYVNYAYEPRGIPTGLVAAIESWRRGGRGRLITLFHEVHASGPPWRSSFWLGPIQKRLAARLLRASDAAVTSLSIYRDQLRRLGGDPLTLAVFSTCGEPQSIPPFEARLPTLVVFGSPGNRARIYGSLQSGLAWAVQALEAQAIHDVGSPIPLPERVAGVPVVGLGRLGDTELSACLLSARAGVLAHSPEFLPKSTTYAAYAAHGVVPVALGKGTVGPTGRVPALVPFNGSTSMLLARAVAEAGRQAYASHALAVHASTYAQLLADPGVHG